MATTLKCPNPSCPYLFDPTTVPAGVVLVCPRCTMQFTLGTPAVPATAPGPFAPAHHAAGSVFAEMTPETAKPDGETRPRLPVRRSRFQTAVLVGVAAVALAGAAIATWYRLTHKPGGTHSDRALTIPERNLALEDPPSPWVLDGGMQSTFGAPYIRVYKRDNPDAIMAIGARDYETRNPRPSELTRALKQPLLRFLVAGTLREEETIPEGTTWLGVPVRGFNFRGQLKTGAVVNGEAYAVTHQGFGYWFLAWTGENQIYEEQRSVFAKFRKGCRLLHERDNWAPRQANVVEFKNNVLGYTIVDGEGIWKEETDEKMVKAEDPKADKFLTAKIKQPGSDFASEAELTIFVLDSQGDPLEQGRAYVEARENRDVENRGKTIFQPLTEDTSFDPPNPVEGNAPFVLLKSKNERSDQTRLWAISAISVKKQTVVACARCLFTHDDRELFERKFGVLVRSLHAME